jgi:hypothetical protein
MEQNKRKKFLKHSLYAGFWFDGVKRQESGGEILLQSARRMASWRAIS